MGDNEIDVAPLTPSSMDLRDFQFMPLDVRRLLTSETWIEAADDPKLGHALVCLWCESWHQVPAGSLPDNRAGACAPSPCAPLMSGSVFRNAPLPGGIGAPMGGCITRPSAKRPVRGGSTNSRDGSARARHGRT